MKVLHIWLYVILRFVVTFSHLTLSVCNPFSHKNMNHRKHPKLWIQSKPSDCQYSPLTSHIHIYSADVKMAHEGYKHSQQTSTAFTSFILIIISHSVQFFPYFLYCLSNSVNFLVSVHPFPPTSPYPLFLQILHS